MISTIELILAAIIAVLVWAYFSGKHGAGKMPPGPPKIPIFGNLHLMGGKPHVSFANLREKYGDIYSFQFGSYPGVVLNGSKVLRQALADMSTSGRHKETIAFDREGGIVMSEGKAWAEQRRFTLKSLRDMGFGKKSIEDIIKMEIAELLDGFQKLVGQPNDFHMAFNAAVLNSIWVMVTGQRFSHSDPKLMNLIKLIMESTRSDKFSFLDALSLFIRWMKPIQFVSSFKRTVGNYMEASYKLFDEVIQQHSPSGRSVQEGGDLIDVYLKEMSETTDPQSSFYGPKGVMNLRTVLFDLFIAGTETTSTTIMYTMQYMALHQDIQEKLYLDIVNHLGTDRTPSLADRPNLLYTEAVILETLRHSSLLPRSLIHKTTAPYKIQEYEIPANTIVIPNLYSAHYDKAAWGDPENFRPERFLVQNGDGSLTLNRHHESLMPFSFGKRICLGETLARDQLLLYIASIFQRFKVTPAEQPFKIEHYVTPITLPPVAKKLLLEER